MCVGIFSYLSRSTVIAQSRAVESKPTEQFFDAFSGFCPTLMKGMALAVAWVCRLSLIPLLIASAMDLRTWSCLHRYRPSPSSCSGCVLMSLLWNKGGMQVFLFCPICTGWMDLGGHHRPLNQELDPLGVPLPDVLPSDTPLHRLLPLHPGTLLQHGHFSAGSLFLD